VVLRCFTHSASGTVCPPAQLALPTHSKGEVGQAPPLSSPINPAGCVSSPTDPQTALWVLTPTAMAWLLGSMSLHAGRAVVLQTAHGTQSLR
jgi:hypothetical protein